MPTRTATASVESTGAASRDGRAKRAKDNTSSPTKAPSKRALQQIAHPVANRGGIVDPAGSRNGHSEIVECLEAFIRTVHYAGIEGVYHLDPLTVEHWKRLVDDREGNWLEVAKYKRDAFLAFHYGTEPVPCPFSLSVRDCPGRLFNGPLNLALDSIVRFRKQGNRSRGDYLKILLRRHRFLSTILQVKLICPRPSQEMLDRNTRKTFESLTTESKEIMHAELPPSIDVEEDRWRAPSTLAWDADEEMKLGKVIVTRDLFRKTVRSVIEQSFPKKAKKVLKKGKCLNDVFFPPTRANFEYSVSKGGGVAGFIRDPFLRVGEQSLDNGLLPDIEEHAVEDDDVDYSCYGYSKDDTAAQDAVWSMSFHGSVLVNRCKS
jgi:hypothetical protein